MGEPNLIVHDFVERLKFSEEASHEPFWQAVYKKAFPEMLFAHVCTGKCQGQYLGIDRIIYFKSGKTIYIDEKKREKDYDDILLEYVSVDKLGTPGWIESDLLIDYLAYAFLPSQRCYPFPWLQLKRVWIHFKPEWMKKYNRVEAQNNGYKTLSLAIPINVLLAEMKNSTIIKI